MRNPAVHLLALALMLAPFSGCLSDGGTEIPNELRGTLYTASGTPAVNAQVRLYPVGYAPGDSGATATVSAKTDASGRFALKKVPTGEYNLVATGQNASAFQDSILLTQGTTELGSDTLRAPGTLTAKVQLQPQHSPQTVIVQVLGTQYYSNVAANGLFTLTLPQGTYRLRVSTILPEYAPLFVTITATSGVNDTLPEPLEPFYSGIPAVTGLKATPDSTGAIHLSWNKSKLERVQAYLIYRDSLGSILPSATPYKSTADTSFIDTLYTTAYPVPAGRYSHLDTLLHAFTYRVRVLDISDQIGTVSGSAQGTPILPARKFTSGRWHRALESAPFGARLRPSVVEFDSALWLFGGLGQGAPNSNSDLVCTDVWKSTDGIQWQKVLDSLPSSRFMAEGYNGGVRATVNDGKLWILAHLNEPDKDGRSLILSSGNGTTWTVVKDSLLDRPSIIWSFQGKLHTYHSHEGGSPRDVYSSVNGMIWTIVPQQAPLPVTTTGSARGVVQIAALDDKLWVLGGGGGSVPYGIDAFRSSDASTWTKIYSRQGDFLPRIGHTLVGHAGNLWSIGGRHYPETLYYNIPLQPLQSQVWNSTDGTSWNLVDLAPFPPRDQPAAISFNGRLWVIGGIQADGTNDIWYYE